MQTPTTRWCPPVFLVAYTCERILYLQFQTHNGRCQPAENRAAAVATGEMDGIEAGREITTQQGIPVVFLTGYPDSAIGTIAQEISAAPVLGKPVSISAIERAIQTVLGQG